MKCQRSEEPGLLLCCSPGIAAAALVGPCVYASLETEAGCLAHQWFNDSITFSGFPPVHENKHIVVLFADRQTRLGQSFLLNPLLTLRKVTCQQQEVCEGEQSKNDPHAAENRDTPIASFIIIITIFVLCRVFLELPWVIGIFWKAETPRAVGECKWLCRAKFVKSRELWSDKQQLVFHKGGLWQVKPCHYDTTASEIIVTVIHKAKLLFIMLVHYAAL